jgi:hypothetical protein
MVQLLRPKDYRPLQNLPFCYICGDSLKGVAKPERDRDHVPPKTLFVKSDRLPLILPTHTKCNGSNNLVDQKMGQLVGLKHGYVPSDPVESKN